MTDYVELETFKQYLRMPADVSDDDALLSMAISTASRAVEQATGRTFGVTTLEARYYTVYRFNNYYFVDIDDLFDTTGMSVNTTSDGATYIVPVSFVALPINAAAYEKPYTTLQLDFTSGGFADTVEVAALWGWTAIPDTIANATLIQANRFWKRRDAPFGIAGSPDMGSEMRLLSRVDPDVELMVRPYKRVWSAV